MRIIQITPGTGSFYCGSCIRDNALVLAMRRFGHDALMVPLYLPLMSDEAIAAEGLPTFFGGVNVYLQQKLSFFRKSPAWLDNWFNTPALLRYSAKKAGMTKASELGEMTISMLKGEKGLQVKELDKLTDWLSSQNGANIVCLSNVLLIGMGKQIRERLKTPVICTLQGEDTFLDALSEPYRSQAWELLIERAKGLDGFIAVSRYYGEVMKERLQLPDDKLKVIYNGISLEGYDQTLRHPDKPVVGFLARLCKTKGLENFVEAFIQLKKSNAVDGVKARAAGSMPPADEPFVNQMKDRLKQAGVEKDFEFLPNLERHQKIDFLRTLSVLSVPTTYGESFGLYLLEAWAAGVPVFQPRHAAFVELIEDTQGGRLYDHNDPNVLATGLAELLNNHEETRLMGQRGQQAVFERFSIDYMAQAILNYYHEVIEKNATVTV